MIAAWKRVALLSFCAGVGASLGIALVVGSISWYKSRPRPPKPWDDKAITAFFDSVDIEGPGNIVFQYILENSTDYDCRVSEGPDVKLFSRLKKEKSLSPYNFERLRTDYPIVIPAKQRMLVKIYFDYLWSWPPKPQKDASAEELKKWKIALSEYLNREGSNLDGFFILNADRRCRIEFPKGW